MEFARGPRGTGCIAARTLKVPFMDHTRAYCCDPVHIVRCVKKVSHFRHSNGHSCMSIAGVQQRIPRHGAQYLAYEFAPQVLDLNELECDICQISVGDDCRSGLHPWMV
jgi:hypothetical protein